MKSIKEVLHKFNLDSGVTPPYCSKLFTIKDENCTGEVWIYARELIYKYPDKLIEYLKTDPELLVTDDVIKLAIGILTDCANKGTQDEASFAKEILKRAGLFHLARGGSRKRTRFLCQQQWKDNPSSLLVMVEGIHLKLFHNRETCKDRLSAYQKTYSEYFKEQISTQTLNKLLTGEHDADQWRETLALISHRFDVPYEMLRKVYNKARKQMTINEAREIERTRRQWREAGKVQITWGDYDTFKKMLRLPSELPKVVVKFKKRSES